MTNEKPKAIMSWSLDVECPSCGENLDLADSPHDDDGEIAKSIFTYQWGELDNLEVWCDQCDSMFEIECVEY